MASPSRPLLEVHDLQASYGAIKALRGLSFEVETGQVVSLIGANGAGKSTTLNTVSGLLKPTGGRVIFDGHDITGWRADRVTALGLIQVPEGRQIIAPMSVYENLIIGTKSDADLKADLDDTFRPLPTPLRAPRPEGGLAERRRAADAGGRAGADDAPALADAGRAEHGTGAADRQRDFPHYRRH